MIEEFIRSRITELRLSKNLSEQVLSELLGFNSAYINQICSGKHLPSYEALKHICDFFEITMSDFFSAQLKNSGTSEFYAMKLNEIDDDDVRRVVFNFLSKLDKTKIDAIKLLIDSFRIED